jgi:hypothetical protein
MIHVFKEVSGFREDFERWCGSGVHAKRRAPNTAGLARPSNNAVDTLVKAIVEKQKRSDSVVPEALVKEELKKAGLNPRRQQIRDSLRKFAPGQRGKRRSIAK